MKPVQRETTEQRVFGMTGAGHEGRIQALEKAPQPLAAFVDTIAYPQTIALPLGLEYQLVGGGWSTTIDTARKNNFKLEYAGAGAGQLIWPVVLGPGSWTIYINAGIGPSYGTITCYLAGGYDTLYSPGAGPPAGDWFEISSHDLGYTGGDVYYNYLRRPQDIDLGSESMSWLIPDGTFGETRSTTRNAGGQLDGGPGYFYFRLDLTNYIDLSEIAIVREI